MISHPHRVAHIFLSVAGIALAQAPVAPSGAGTPENPYRIDSLPNLAWIPQNRVHWDKVFRLGADIDARSTALWDSGKGFLPIGDSVMFPDPSTARPFKGAFHGGGHRITGLTIHRPGTENLGLFGLVTAKGYIDSIVLDSVDYSGSEGPLERVYAGAVAGSNLGTIVACRSTGRIEAHGDRSEIGGITGANFGKLLSNWSRCDLTTESPAGVAGVGGISGNNSGEIADCRGEGTRLARCVRNSTFAGGLVGHNLGSIKRCSAHGITTATGRSLYLAGLVGDNDNNGTIDSCRSSGRVEAVGTDSTSMYASYVGGLAGVLHSKYIRNSYSTTEIVSRGQAVTAGGLLGSSGDDVGEISNCFATGSIELSPDASATWGGLVGYFWGASIAHAYATGSLRQGGVTIDAKSGLFGRITGTYQDCYWDSASSGMSMSTMQDLRRGNKSAPLSDSSARQASSYAGFDFDKIWAIHPGHTRPFLRAFLQPVLVRPRDSTRIYDRTAFRGGSLEFLPPVRDSLVHGQPVWGGTSQGAVDPGLYATTASGLWSEPDGYWFEYAPGSLRIRPRPASLAGLSVPERAYDATTRAELIGSPILDSVLAGDSVTLAGSPMASFLDPHAQAGKTAVVAGLRLTGPDSARYVLTDTTLKATITPRPMTVIAMEASKSLGSPDPVFTYKADPLLGSDRWSGALGRNPGDSAGSYPLTLGTLSAGPDYALAFQPSILSIVPSTSVTRRAAPRPTNSVKLRMLSNLADRDSRPDASTTLVIELPASCNYHVALFDNQGTPVRQWKADDAGASPSRRLSAPRHVEIPWDLRDASGHPVASGVYLWRIQTRGAGSADLDTVVRTGVR